MRQRIVVTAVIGAVAATLAAARSGPAPRAEAPGWTNLFDGASIAGWKASEHPEAWTVKDGTLACSGDRAHLFYTGPVEQARFENFEAEVEVKTHPGANSGVFFHTAWQDRGWPAQGFEVQVNNTQPVFPGDTGTAYRENKKTGSLYGIRNTYKALARDGEWFTLKVRVQVPRVTIHVNDTLVVDYVEPEGEVAGLAAPLQKLAGGTFALQCHDPGSRVQYRRIAVHPLPPTPPSQVRRAPNPDPALAKRYRLARDNFPLVDLRTLDVSDRQFQPELEKALAAARAGGLFVGVTVPAGADVYVAPLLDALRGKPVFVGLRTAGAELRQSVSEATLAAVDFVLLDGEAVAKTVGWAPAADNADAYAAMVADKIVGAMRRTQADVLGAPTALAEGFASEHERLWTDLRMKRVIDAAVEEGVAFEINGRLKLPNEAFVRQAKAAGARFTLGECAVDTPAGVWCFDLVEKVGLTWRDMYQPGHEPPRAAR